MGTLGQSGTEVTLRGRNPCTESPSGAAGTHPNSRLQSWRSGLRGHRDAPGDLSAQALPPAPGLGAGVLAPGRNPPLLLEGDTPATEH